LKPSAKETKVKTEEFVYATYIRTTPEKLWEALTSGDFSENIGSASGLRLN